MAPDIEINFNQGCYSMDSGEPFGFNGTLGNSNSTVRTMDERTEIADDPSGSITILFQEWKQGRPEALGELIGRFQTRLLALAQSTLGGRLPLGADAEDAVQSALISFWESVDGGGLRPDMDRDDLWNILGLFTVRKALKLQEKAQARKRGGGQVMSDVPLENSVAPVSQGEADLASTELLEMLEPDLRSFALLKLMGYTNREIAGQYGCSERKVERKLQLVRAVWADEMRRWQG